MHRSVLVFWSAALLAVPGLSAPAMAGDPPLPSASGTDADPVLFPDEVTTTTSEGNPDGSRTVTTTDSEGNVTEQHTVPSAEQEALDAAAAAANDAVDAAADAANDAVDAAAAEADAAADGPDTGGPPSAVPPPTTPEQAASDALIDMEEQIRDLRYKHRDLLDQAGETEDPEAFQELVDQAQQTLNEMYELQDAYEEQSDAFNDSMNEEPEYIDMNAMAAGIEALEEQLDGFPEAIDQAETDEEAEALEQEQAEAEAALRELQEEFDRINEETREGAIQRAQERHRLDTGRQGAMQGPKTPSVPHAPPSVGSRLPHRSRY